MTEWIGSKWLAATWHITPVQPFWIESQISSARRTVVYDGLAQESFPASFRPSADLAGHLTFAFKYEGIHLEFLARLFAKLDPQILVAWINAEPTGGYARRAGFFYEWLTGQTLPVPDTQAGNYVDAISAANYLVASHPLANKRWRVRDNLPGTPAWCPCIHRSDAVKFAESYDCAEALTQLQLEYGQEIVLRSAVWLTVKESRASFAIEHEENQSDRIQRFAAVMESRCGQAEEPLADERILALQAEILGPQATRYGLRRSPVFVGHRIAYNDVVDYIAPDWQDTPALLAGLSACLQRTKGQAPIIRAALASFGFVYIHPLADGNGRISRFLVNDILRRDGAVPAPFILPISATIAHTPKARAGYDRSLELFSRPLMQTYRDQYEFGLMHTYDDGISSNFQFCASQDALFAWRYPNLTGQVEYLVEVIKQTLQEEMVQEAKYLRSVYIARQRVKDYLEGPDVDIDRIIRGVRENDWVISNRLQKAFPMLAEPGLAEQVSSAIRTAFLA